MQLGLTGNIATGKSTVFRLLSKRNDFLGFDADAVVHRLYGQSTVVDRLIAEFSCCILDESGVVDRSQIRKLFLADESVRGRLEAIFHPLVYMEYQKSLSELQPNQVMLADIPLLFEKESPYDFDYTVTVACSTDLQLSRLIARSNLDKDVALKMINKQVALSYKMRQSDCVLWNNGSLDLLQRQLNLLVHRIF